MLVKPINFKQNLNRKWTKYRDSVTLSYYAMYSYDLALLLKKDISPETHECTLRQLAKEFIDEVETLIYFSRNLKSGFYVKPILYH